MAELDPETVRAVREEMRARKAAEREEASAGRVKETRKKEAAKRATGRARTKGGEQLIAARTASDIQRRQAASAIKLEQSRQNRAAIAQEARAVQPGRRERYTTAAQGAAERQVVSAATPSSDSNLVMTTLFIMAGLIVMYIIVTNPSGTTGWLGTIGNGLHKLSSNTPLFTTVKK